MDPNNQNIVQSSTRDETYNNRPTDATSSPVSDSTHESTFCSMSPTQSPPIQVMERPVDFSNRFSSSSEWSSVSNESLFSIHIANSYTHDQAHLLAEEAFKYGDLMSFRDHFSVESDLDSLKVETPTKVDVNISTLDEPQKVVRWKTQVERVADEGGSLTNQKSSESTAKPKKKFCWSFCECGSCNVPKWSCSNSCWTSMTCSNCKLKKVCSSHATETNAPTRSPTKPDVKLPKVGFKRGCCFKPGFSCSRSCSLSWSCHCC